MKIVIIGIGQHLRGDDGAGQAAVEAWIKAYPQTAANNNLRVEMEELPGISLISLLDGAQAAIIVDAINSHRQAGEIHLLSVDQIGSFPSGSGSVHGIGVAEAIALGKELEPEAMPDEINIIGIEVENIEMGDSLSRAVKRALPGTVELIEEHVQRLLQK